jgi:hypothetical protein
MSLGKCQLAECTFNVTGACVLNRPIEQCAHRSDLSSKAGSSEGEGNIDEVPPLVDPSADGRFSANIGSAVLTRPDEIPHLPLSLTIGLDEATALMIKRNTTMVGILGLPDSGKTACLVSAYLLLANGKFDGYDYTDSSSLMAFEQISRGSRSWTKGDAPGQLTTHTEMADDRQAGFLHFRLRRHDDGRFFDILLPDIPGEWSKALIDKADSERFAFLGSASVIWMMVDGRLFADPAKKMYAIYRAETLLERLSSILPTPRPRIILVASWRDIGEFPQDAYQRIFEEGCKYGMTIALKQIASFSFGDVPPGSGVASLIDATLNHDRPAPDFWPSDRVQGSRTLSCFRNVA